MKDRYEPSVSTNCMLNVLARLATVDVANA